MNTGASQKAPKGRKGWTYRRKRKDGLSELAAERNIRGFVASTLGMLTSRDHTETHYVFTFGPPE